MTDRAGTAKLSLKAIVFLVISITGFIFYGLYDKQVFPAASIDLKLSQKEAAEKSRKLVSSLGYDADHAKQVTTFTNDEDAKTVLEFKLGIDKANELMKSQVPVWLWHTRFCKELSQDEYLVTWTTAGQFKSIYHRFGNDVKIPSITQDEALALAKQFVANTAGMDMTGYDLYDKGSEKQPNRTDHHFVWRKPGYKECEFRIRVEVAGNKVATCRYWLAPTDTWTREYKSIRQWNELLGGVASLFLFLFIAATIGAFIHGVSRHNVRWRFTLISSACVALLVLLEQINNFSYTLEDYNTTAAYSDFLLQTAVSYLLMSVGAFVASLLITGGAEVIYRATRPGHTTLQNLFNPAGMAQKDYARKTLIGYLLVGVMMFWAIGYYKIGQKLGYFCPLGVDDYKVLGNFCPAISGALIGVTAAGLEEFSCRVVALGLMQRLTKNFWLANLLQALVWGFAHSTYPQEPCYARGVELTVVGLLFGYIVKTYGVLPCLIAHYLYDAFLTVEPVFASHRPELILPSLLILTPFLAAVWYSRRWSTANKVAVEEIDLTNASEQSLPEAADHEHHEFDSPPAYGPLSATLRKRLALVAVLGACLALIPARDPIGKSKEVTVTATKAVALAGTYMAEDGIDPKDHLSVCQMQTDPESTQDGSLTWQYIYEKMGYEKARAIYDQVEPGLKWIVRYFKPNDPQSCHVFLNANGSKRCTEFEDIDEAAGANLDESAALAQVQSYIKKNRPELLPFTLETQSKTAEPKRFDYKFDFHIPKYDAAETPAELHIETKGDKVAKLYIDWKVPDDWSWPRKKQHWYQKLIHLVRIAFIIMAGVAGLAWGLHLMRKSRVPWRLALYCGVIWSVAAGIGVLNASAQSLMNYDTAEQFENFIWQTITGRSTMCLLGMIACFVISIMGVTALRNAFPEVRRQLHSWILLKPENSAQRVVRSNLWVDGAIGSYALTAAFVALQSVQHVILSYCSPVVPLDIPNRLAAIFSTSVPAIETLSFICCLTIGAPLALAIFASLWQRFLRSKTGTNGLILASAILFGADSWYWQNCLVNTMFLWYKIFLVLYFVRKIFAGNALAYIFATAEISSLLTLADMLAHASQVATLEITLLACVIAAPALLAVTFWLVDRKHSEKASQSQAPS